MLNKLPRIVIFALPLFLLGCTTTKPWSEPTEHRINRPADMNWQEALASMPAGMKMTVLEGDPTKPGPYVVRLRMIDGCRIPPHMHPGTERVTILAGTLHWGMGEKFDQNAAQALTAGTYAYWPAGMKHFAWTTGETEIQLHGTGPWGITYLDPTDDPRQKSN